MQFALGFLVFVTIEGLDNLLVLINMLETFYISMDMLPRETNLEAITYILLYLMMA